MREPFSTILLLAVALADDWAVGIVEDVNFTYSKGYIEVTPEFVVGGSYVTFLTYSLSYACVTSNNIILTDITLDPAACTLAFTPYALKHADEPSVGFLPNSVPLAEAQGPQAWRLMYAGVFSTRLVLLGGTTPLQIGIVHGENKNANMQPTEVAGLEGQCWNGTILPQSVQPACTTCFCGRNWCTDESSSNCSYSAFISLVTVVPDQQHSYGWTMFDNLQGPIAWPLGGYVTGSGSASVRMGNGLRHPRALITDNYLHVFYIEDEYGDNFARAGVKVIRASLNGTSLSASDFRSWCNTSSAWVPSLPNGFTLANLESFLNQPGGCATPVLEFDPLIASTRGFTIQFTAIEDVAGGQRYIGLEEFFIFGQNSINTWGLRLWRGTTLTSFTEPVVIRSFSGLGGDVTSLSDMRYPVLMDAFGLSHDLVNSSQGFWVVGVYHLGGVRPPLKRLYVRWSAVTSTVTPTNPGSHAPTNFQSSTAPTASNSVSPTSTAIPLNLGKTTAPSSMILFALLGLVLLLR